MQNRIVEYIYYLNKIYKDSQAFKKITFRNFLNACRKVILNPWILMK